MYIGNMEESYNGAVYMHGRVGDKLKARWKKFKSLSPKDKAKRLILGTILAPVAAATAGVMAPMALAAAPVAGTVGLAKKAAQKNPKLKKALRVAALGLIPGVGPMVATAAAAKMAMARKHVASARPVEQAEEAVAENTLSSVDEVKEENVEAVAAEEKKAANKKMLTTAAIGAGALFLLPMLF